MKSTVTQYLTLAGMLLLIAMVVSLLPENARSLDSTSSEHSTTTAANSISVTKSTIEN